MNVLKISILIKFSVSLSFCLFHSGDFIFKAIFVSTIRIVYVGLFHVKSIKEQGEKIKHKSYNILYGN